MKNDKYDVRWSPFDPQWYQQAFDKPINTSDMLSNEESIINSGFILPDSDGSRSSIFRNEAVLNNSFSEELLRESLKDIYNNNSHKLIASNHDNTHFYQWIGKMSDMDIISNTNYCQFVIPIDSFIYPNERDRFKLSQFYRKWIKIEDILNNWDIFKWHCLLFIDQRIYSEYEFRIDDMEVTIRFRYYDFWIKQDYPVYIYKFDTNVSSRILITKELCENQWNWKIPIEYITDKRILNSDKAILSFNKISDKNIRKDGETNVEILGDNLEFVKISNGFIDISNISDFNKSYILSEKHEWIWMSIFVPSFFHEYPIILPTDVVYQSYEANLQPVSTLNYDMIQHVKSKINYTDDIYSQVYVDINNEFNILHDSWKQLIRPIVLSDAFDNNYVEPYDRLLDDINKLKDLTIYGADLIEEFRFYVKNYKSDHDFKEYCNKLIKSIDDIRTCMHGFLDKLYAEYDKEYELLYKKFITIMDEINEVGVNHDLFHTVSEYERPDRDFWMVISPLIWIPRNLADKYYVINIIHDMGNRINVWEDIKEYENKVRFQRPIDVSDFWTFEYDIDKQVWRPYPLSINRHFPDVYILKDEKEKTPSLNRIFKSFFFYSDTMNVVNQSSDIVRPTQSWDNDIEEYHINQSAIYRDIFMEKFYWMGMQSIYKGILVTKNRWEIIEYVIDNKSYDRFNELFLNTMDPYFKLGLATYLRSPNYGFPFDDAISKMKESIDSEFINYKKITNFEVYLNKTWIPSYFDYITNIMDDWKYEDRLVRRPRSTFDIYRLLPFILSAQLEIYDATRNLVNLINWIIERLNEENYKININNIIELKELIGGMYDGISSAYNYSKNLDIYIYSIDDINSIADKLKKYISHQVLIDNKFKDIYTNITEKNVHSVKREVLDKVYSHIDIINDHIDKISSIVNDFNFDNFMSIINELQTYFDHNKDNPNDNSLLGHINKFDDPWTNWVKTKRTNLFLSSNELFGFYDTNKLYEDNDIDKLMNLVSLVSTNLEDLQSTIDSFYKDFNYTKDEVLYNKFDNTLYLLNILNIKLNNFLSLRNELVNEYDLILKLLNDNIGYFNPTELEYLDNINISFKDIIKHLSYIAGKNHKDEAENSLKSLVNYIHTWYRYLDIEKEVFDNLILLANPPIEIVTIIEKYHDIMISIIDYMDTVNIKYIPDSQWPTYSDVYKVTKVEIVSPGFENKEDDYVFAYNLGTYKVSEISGNNKKVISLIDTLYRNTTFRNPMIQYRPYDTITNGNGMGITIKPIEIEHKVIINDTVIEDIIVKIKNSLRIIDKSIKSYNPVSNNDMKYVIKDIDGLKELWNKLIDRFWEHMTPSVKLYTDELVNDLVSFITPCNGFIDTRDSIKLSEFIKIYQDYIYDSYNYIKRMNIENETFFYYDAIIRQSYTEVIDFYGTGSSWTNGNSLRMILIDASRHIKFYWKKVLDSIDRTETVIHIEDLKNNLIDLIRNMINAIDECPIQVIDIQGMINRLNTKLEKVPHLSKDIWYRIKNSDVAIEGMEYKIGDIVEVIPNDEDVANMVPLTLDELDNVINNNINFDYDKDSNNDTGVRQVNASETDTLWNDGNVYDNPGNQRIKLLSMKRNEVIKLWNGETIFEDLDDTNIDDDSEEVILMQVTNIDEFGRVKSVKPFMDYALPYNLHGVRKTRTRIGNGYGLQINLNSVEIQLSDSTLLNDEDSYIPKHDKFDENDLMKFKFDNIHDLNINYEIFLGGKQITNFILRHIDNNDPLYPQKIDEIYINANQVINLQNSSIYIPSEHYFIYKIDNIDVKDPGAGYCLDQNIYVGTDNTTLHMKVSQVKYCPYKGIEIATLSDSGLLYRGFDPSKIDAVVVPDSMNNIDDEFNVGYYDKLTKDGIVKPLTRSFNSEEYSYIAKRYDDLINDDRNMIFMYPNVNIKDGYPNNGDPDYKWYQGSRIDNSYVNIEYSDEDKSVWNGILNVIPPTDPFIPDIQRTPINQPVKGEYQLIQSLRIHNTSDSSNVANMVPLTLDELDNVINNNINFDYDKDSNNDTGVRQVNASETDTLWNDGNVYDNPGNQRIKLKIISPLELFTLWNGGIIVEEDDELNDYNDIIDNVTSVFNFRVNSLENACMIKGDLVVEHFSDLPRHKEDYPEGGIGKNIIVEHDETNYGHRMLYRIRTFVAAGFFVYDLPEVADYVWNEFNVNWMESDWFVDFPTPMAQYPEAPWDTSPSYRKVMHKIIDNKIPNTFTPKLLNNSSFISNLTLDDISVYNWSTHEWEDLHDSTRWELITKRNDDTHEWGFTLRFLQEGTYSYDMRLYLNKTPYTQQKNAELKRNATMDISTIIHSEVNKPAINMSVNTGRHLRIRKLFPYEQRESYKLGFDSDGTPLGYKMDFKLSPYIHYKNQVHLEDIKIFNKSANRFEDLFDTRLFEVQFKDPKATSRGFETQTKINSAIISNAGKGFINGIAWAYNHIYNIIVFGYITTDYLTDGHLIKFIPSHCPNLPEENISLEFEVFQNMEQSDIQKGVVIIEFITERIEVFGDGYIHNVTNPLAPVPNEIRIILLYDLDGIGEYDVIINNTPKSWSFIEPNWMMIPKFHIDGYQESLDKLYVLTDKGRFPLVNPSTKKPTLNVKFVNDGMDILFMNLYRKFNKININSVPYPMRSVYVQRKIPKNGYINLYGKINKPLNKKYFEFWVNGKLMNDEVTIISPTKIFLHGLKSLKNLEIVEINRDPNEYFSDSFIEINRDYTRPYLEWNYKTYLDDALEGNLKNDNYTIEEQEYLLTPVWSQVLEDHPEYKNYPPNVDIEDDILLMITKDDIDDIDNLENPLYQYMIIDPPTLEGKPIFDQESSFEHFGLLPITDEMIVDMLNEEWKEEIKNDPYLKEHSIISDDEWYGTTARLYDEYGILVHTLNESAYNIHTDDILRINTKTKSNKIVKHIVEYDLT